MPYPRITIAATNSGAGKTTLVMGLILALKKQGVDVQPFKAGPDYIDPSYHSAAAGRICRNLDTWMLPKDVVLELFERQARTADISLIEGVMGLYDGSPSGEEGSTSHLAKVLKSPVILIVNAQSMSRSAAAVVLGYQKFDKAVSLQGVVLNNISSPSHYRGIKEAIEHKTGLPVLGFLPRDKELMLPERHLGLVPAEEKKPADDFKKKLLQAVEQNINTRKIIQISRAAPALPRPAKRIFNHAPARERVVIALARDAAFNFYYQDNLDILSYYGAELVEFSPLRDKALPDETAGVYIGGGFPELFAGCLEKNTGLKADIRKKAQEGMPIYAECGGLMYLVKSLIDFNKKKFPMTGIFEATVNMGSRLRAMGYAEINTIKENILSKKGGQNRGHIFHWSELNCVKASVEFAYKLTLVRDKVRKSAGRTLHPASQSDGLIKGNTLASYSHLHFGANVKLAKNFINSCLRYGNK